MGMIRMHDIVGPQRVTFNISAAAQGDATKSNVIFVAPFTCKIRAVAIFFDDDITGTATNYFNHNLVNRGTDGTGTTELANIDYASGQDASKYVLVDLYSPTTYLDAATGIVLDLVRELVSSGLATPSLHGYVEFEGA